MALVSSPNPPQFTAGRFSNPPMRSTSAPARNDNTNNNNNNNTRKNKLLFVGFNQDFGCVAVGTEKGFTIYNSDPFKETLRREFNDGGIAVVEMLFRCNILAIVGGGSNPPYPPNKVMIWDDHQSRCIGELSFRADVRAVKLRRDMIVVVLDHKIYVYNFADLKLLHQIETVFNGEGVSALSSASTNAVLACPGLRKGQLRLDHLSRKKTMFIGAHDSYLSCIAITADGRFVATSSHRGTLIRVFNTLDGTRMQELRRGTDRAVIYSLAFSANAQWLAVSSDKGTVHVFGLRSFTGIGDHGTTGQASKDEIGTVNNAGTPNIDSATLASNPGSSLSFMRGVLPSYFSSEWSVAQFRLPEETRAIVGFGPQKNTILVVSTDGRFYKCAFDPVRGGEMIQQEYTKFLRPDEDESHL